jgi:predicted dehydrogenase
MKVIKAGVIGVGYLGKFHAQKYAQLDNVTLVGVADTDAQQCERVALENSCKPFADYREMLDQVDAVSIAVPTSLHHKVAGDCLSAGVDVLLEKPMTVTLDEADDLIQRAQQNRLILQIGHLERFNPAVMAMRPHLTTPVFVESHRIATFKNRGTDVDVVLDLMIHDIDIILNIIKSPIKQMHTVGAPVATPITDIANARIIFENGATANVTVSRISHKNERRMRIFQPGSYINVDFGNRKVTTVQLTGESAEGGMPKQEISQESFENSDALLEEIVSFTDHVRNRTEPAVTGPDGRRALAVALEVMEQIREHQKLDLFQNIVKRKYS